MDTTYQHLSAEERGAIMAMKLQECSIRQIAHAPGRAPRTVSRELRRNGYLPQAELGPMPRPCQPINGGLRL